MKRRLLLLLLLSVAMPLSITACNLVDSTSVAIDTTIATDTISSPITDSVAKPSTSLQEGDASDDIMGMLESQAAVQDSIPPSSKKAKKSKQEEKYDRIFSTGIAANEAVGMCEALNDKNAAVRMATDMARAELAQKLNVEVLRNCVPVQSKVIYNKETALYKAYVKVRME